MRTLLMDWTNYFEKVFSGAKPIIAVAISIINYVLFPDCAYFNAFGAVGIAIILDILTKYLALSKIGGGFRAATKCRIIDSNKLWKGTSIKLVSYLVVFILAGLSYRVTMLTQVSVFLATIIYSVIFLREAQSILENLCDAGADMKWLLVWTKKKEKQILEDDDIDNSSGDGGPTI
ncbi:phage holin family protein [Clostridia bacterium]|nr:phage holin family protein [Clostridia bacterium]